MYVYLLVHFAGGVIMHSHVNKRSRSGQRLKPCGRCQAEHANQFFSPAKRHEIALN